MRANSWLYQFYSLHSKMHFGLAYDVHSPRVSSYFSNASSGPPGHPYTPGTPGSPGTSPDSTHSLPLHPMHAYHAHHTLHAGIAPLHTPVSPYPHHLQYSPQTALPYAMPPAAASPGSESDSSHQTSLKPHPSFPFFPSSAAFVCLC